MVNKKSKKYPFPKKYYQGLSKKDKTKQIKELEKSRDLYKKGIFVGRTQKSSFKSKKSAHLVEFEDKYGVKINDESAVYKVTGITPNAQQAIIKKGMGAFYSSGSRPNQSAQSWAYARLASVILKHNAYNVDRHILIENNCDNIKPPPHKKTIKQKGGVKNKHRIYSSRLKLTKKLKKHASIKSIKSKAIISCCDINDENESSYSECKRNSDGKIFSLPRRFSRSKCSNIRGFSMRSSCIPYLTC